MNSNQYNYRFTNILFIYIKEILKVLIAALYLQRSSKWKKTILEESKELITTGINLEPHLDDGSFDAEVNSKCETMPEYIVDCFTVLSELQHAINAYRTARILELTDMALIKLKLYSSEWREYFTEARSQKTQ